MWERNARYSIVIITFLSITTYETCIVRAVKIGSHVECSNAFFT
jgi:hypothetical protein